MTFGRRLRLYIIGIAIGLILSFVFLGDRLSTTAWMPKDRVKDRLHSTLLRSSENAKQSLVERKLTLEDVRNTMHDAEISLSESIRTDDSLLYRVSSRVKGQELDMLIATLRDFRKDSTATLMELY